MNMVEKLLTNMNLSDKEVSHPLLHTQLLPVLMSSLRDILYI